MSRKPATLAALAAAGACALAVLLGVRDAAAQEAFPAFQTLEGRINASAAAKPIVAASTDELIVINQQANRRESAAFSMDSLGNYLLVISKDSNFNGTLLELRLRKGTDVFALLRASDDTPALFAFVGSLFAERVEFDLRIGRRLSSSAQLPPTTPPKNVVIRPTNTNPDAVECLSDNFDVNGDTKCDEADIDVIHAYLRDNPPGPERTPMNPSPPEDVNRDGFVNARDVLEAVRALQRARVEAARKGVTVERSKIERPTAPARPVNEAASEIEAARAKARERPQ